MGAVSAQWVPTLSRSKSQPVSQAHRLAYWGSVALTAGVVVALVVSIVSAAVFFSRPYLGVMVTSTQVVTGGNSTSGVEWAGNAAGIRSRDRIIAIDGVPLAADPNDYAGARASLDGYLASAAPGQPVEVTVLRGAEMLTFSYNLSTVPTTDVLIFFLIPLVAGTGGVIAAILLLLYRGDRPAVLTGALLCLATGVMVFGLFDISINSPVAPLWSMSACFVAGLMIRFGLIFPNRMPAVYSAPWMLWLPVVAGFVIGLISTRFLLFPDSPTSFSQTQLISVGTALVGAMSWAVLLYNQRRYAATRISRDQTGFLLVGL
ncbi:MAG: PDZ domain-containing protein, partial [Anaerolineae bacterium]|nr:PDZ domain-containing protein [Anaerolineae bacterium]